MTLAPGTRLGSYEIVASIGAGGMGEVYKARDPKLDRFVAIKVLPANLAQDPEFIARFELEAKVLATLQHPNILGIFDFGKEGDTTFAVTELLEGETIREVLQRGPLPQRRAQEVGVGIAQGLAAAHEQGIIHRDLKPGNIFITKAGRVKILDFGLAKRVPFQKTGDAPTLVGGTDPGTDTGVVLGTVGYMSPEQVRGETLDARSDIFSFGCLLYEMLTGHRTFQGPSAVDIMHGILHKDLDLEGSSLSPGLRRILHHCLDKNPAQRFQSAQDLAFALEPGASVTRDLALPSSRALLRSQASRLRLRSALLGAILLLAGIALGGWGTFRSLQKPLSSFQRITFRRGNLLHARFTPDGQNVVYSAAWDGQTGELFLARADGSGARPLGIAGATIQSVNTSGELLVILKPGALTATTAGSGTLARATLDGGAPRELLERVWSADFGPDGKQFAVAYQASEGGAHQLDFPLGRRLLASPGAALSSVRVSPKGDLLAVVVNDPGSAALVLVDLQGSSRALYRATRGSETDLAWAPDGTSLYMMDGDTLLAIDLKGKVRRIHSDSTLSNIHHVALDGRMLVEREVYRRISVVRRDGRDTSLGWQDFTLLVDLSLDGQWALMDEGGGRLGPAGQPLLRRTDGSAPKLLEPGVPLALSPDSKLVLLQLPGKPARLRIVPIGAGIPKDLAMAGWDLLEGAFAPDGKRVYAIGRQGDGPTRILDFPLDGNIGRVIDSPLPRFNEITPDGTQFLGLDDQRRLLLAPVAGGAAVPSQGSLEEGDFTLGWSESGALRIAHAVSPARVRLDSLDLRTGKRTPWTLLSLPDLTGAVRIRAVKASRDGKTVAFTTGLVDVSDLLIVEGLK